MNEHTGITERGVEWSFDVSHYEGEITAEEFASQHQVVAINSHDDDSYSFVGSYENVQRAYDAYTETIS